MHLTPGAVARPGLLEEVLKADAALFKAFFDDCDAEAVSRLRHRRFRDVPRQGRTFITSGEQFVTITKEKCQRQRDGIDFLSTRELVRESVKVFPINNYGAIETGTHRFYAIRRASPTGSPRLRSSRTSGKKTTASGAWRAR